MSISEAELKMQLSPEGTVAGCRALRIAHRAEQSAQRHDAITLFLLYRSIQVLQEDALYRVPWSMPSTAGDAAPVHAPACFAPQGQLPIVLVDRGKANHASFGCAA
jgi:hypothetical protein